MNEEQQKVVEEEVTGYQEQCFHGMIDDMLYSCLDKLRSEDLLPELETPDGPNPEVSKLTVEVEKRAARATIQAAVKYLQNRQEAFPEHASPKLAVVEIEYEIEAETDEDSQLLTVHKVVRDGVRVEMRPTMSDFGGPYWLLFEIYEENLALVQEQR